MSHVSCFMSHVVRKLTGTVVSNKMRKTVVVKVDRLKKHPKYLKRYRVSGRFKVHVDDEKDFHRGDVVVIQETRPMSKEKRWKVIGVVKKVSSGAAEDREQ